MAYHDEGNADDDIGVQHDTNMTTTYIPPAESFYANTWENMVDPSHLQIPFVSTWEDGIHYSKGLTFTNKEAAKRVLIIYARTTGFLTFDIRAVDLDTGKYDQQEILKMVNEVLKNFKALYESHNAILEKVKALNESNMAMKKELSRLQEGLKNITEKELQSLDLMKLEEEIKFQESTTVIAS
ncbi:hypothetical protein SO802_012640 [Lithocarpus litseifolius]|uniref:Uncharacterized protein n=1 Tax=Lithocarpus litseifolius TaxID=425828 RepID=A0AAW2D608_9ROSI